MLSFLKSIEYNKYKKRRQKFQRSILKNTTKPIRHKKDYDWRPKKRNPFIGEEGTDWKNRIEVVILIITLIAIFSLIFYHPFFHIQKFEVKGLQRIDEQEFISTVEGIISFKKFLILPAKNYFLADCNEIHEIILSRFPVRSVLVEKKFPDTLEIVVEEKISTIIYDNGNQYSYLGLSGNIVEILRYVGENEWKEIKITTTTVLEDGTEEEHEEILERYHTPPVKNIITEMGDYPIVYDMREKEAIINNVMLRSETVQGIIEWFNIINRQSDISVTYFLLENELGDCIIKTRDGWEMRVKLTARVGEQFEDLQYILKEKAERTNLNYVDLRYPNRVYWQ